MTETCDPDEPRLLVHVATTLAATHDSKMLETIHADLGSNDLLPAEHLVDQGCIDTELLLTSQAEHGVALIGPVPADQSSALAPVAGARVAGGALSLLTLHRVVKRGLLSAAVT